MKTKRTQLFISILLAASMLAACGASAAKSIADERGFVEAEEMAAPMAEAPAMDLATQDGEFAAAEPSAAGGNAVASERVVIKNANLSIVVDDPEQRMQEITAMASELGGFVVNSNLYKNTLESGVEVPRGSITIRVPSELFDQTLDRIRQGAIDVTNDNRYGQDVTSEYTDLQSRLRNLENAEELLRQIMDEARDTEDVLTAFNQLNNITSQIEVLKGQIKYYDESAAMSAISVELIANAAVQPIKVGPWDITGTAKQAVEALVEALQSIAETLVWFFIYLIPVLLVLAAPVWLISIPVRRWWAKREQTKK